MLRSLDSWVDGLAQTGWGLATGLIEHPFAVAVVITALILLAMSGGRPELRSASLAICAGAWGQALLLTDRVPLGGCLFAVAFAAAAVAGRGLARDEDGARPAAAGVAWDLLAVLALAGSALLVRVYAVDAIPWFVDVEPGGAFLESLSPYGMARYVTHDRVLDDGYVHMLGRWALVHFLGPSIVTLRLVSVGFGVVSVVLAYLVARRFVGTGWAFVAAALLATDPAHLYWSRIEASQIIAASVGTFVSALLALWLARGWSVGAAIACMLWMPMTRYFYAAALGMAVLPVLVCVGGVIRRASRRDCGRVIPVILAGCVLWFHSSSLLHYTVTGHWQWVSPDQVYGRSLIEPHDPEGELGELSVVELAGVQASRLATNSKHLAEHLAYHRDRFSNWLMMAQPDGSHRRSVNAAIAALIIPALGYTVGASVDPSRMAFVIWLIALVLPGLLSEDPEPRRVVGFMSASYVVVAVFLSSVLPTLARHGSWGRFALKAGVAVAAMCIALTNLSSHFLTGRQTTQVSRYIDFAAPAFAEADIVYHNIGDWGVAGTLVFGNASVFLQRFPCFQLVRDWANEWDELTSGRRCSFDDEIYQHLLSAQAVDQLAADFSATEIAYLLEVSSPADVEFYDRLRGRFPQASVARRRFMLPPYGPRDVVLIRVRTGGTLRSRWPEQPAAQVRSGARFVRNGGWAAARSDPE